MRYRKKPVEIEAMQYDGTEAGMVDVCLWAKNSGPTGAGAYEYKDGAMHLRIHTLEGVMLAAPGDWIIKGIKGEFYPCKPDIFAASYDPVDG